MILEAEERVENTRRQRTWDTLGNVMQRNGAENTTEERGQLVGSA